MEVFLGAVINGIALGMAYALIAVGYSMVFGILRLINFSHAAVYAFGAYMVYFFISLKFGLLPAILAAILLSGLLAVLIDQVALKPLRTKASVPIASLITTIGVSFIIQNFLSMDSIFTSEKKGFPSLNLFGNIQFGNLTIQSSQVIMFFTALFLLGLLTFIVQKTRLGLAMRATEQNQRAAHLMGVNVNYVISAAFFIGGASAAISGALIGGYYQIISPTMGAIIGLKAFSAAVVGGIGILYGSVVGGLVVGISETVAAQYLGSNVRDPMAFVILILILIIKPNGLFGKKGISKV
ncbi:MAG: branched-chain amino acid ABC transporter permease [Eubacteriales bacterium]|jgi:branched-chain amino acid transport system permease protein|nr:branched-chain amino acid ABC transporter permease [Eubacteriales bacterium]MDD3571362.1 branched-chain amino acid ABC transporter permease [Eubacteriales bacterium]NLV59028.1 branched-chain amino acid ABC transporter permease [Clostridiales bacterium]